MSIDATRDPAPDADDAGPLGGLPRLGRTEAGLAETLARVDQGEALRPLLGWMTEPIGLAFEFGRPEVSGRAAGLKRPGVIAQFVWPRLGTRVGLGLELPTAHALVDRLLGYDREPGEERLQATPVEWGLLGFAFARTLARLAEGPGPLGEWDLLLDRVGPEPFAAEGLGPLLTVRWPLRVGGVQGSARLWLPGSLAGHWLLARPPEPPELEPSALAGRLGEVESRWTAEAGTLTLRRGLAGLRPGLVRTFDGATWRGTVESPDGPVALALRDRDGRYVLPADPAPQSGGAALVVRPPIRREFLPREVTHVSDVPDFEPASAGSLPATLTVELGRVSLPLARLADLRPGDLIELERDPAAPVELTSGGRLVARGELVQVEDELGVRVTAVYL